MSDVAALAGKLIANIEKVIIGKRQPLTLALAAYLCEGHVLLEDVPGVAKTMFARALAVSVGCTFKRLQCTPDLLPTDVTGVSIFNQKTAEFEFRPGPIFAQTILTDEINLDDKVRTYILQIVHASREHEDVLLGASPRASIALFRTAQALAAIGGRDFVLPDDVKRMAHPVLAHRIILKPESRLRKRTSSLIVQDIVADTAVPVLKESYEGVRDDFA